MNDNNLIDMISAPSYVTFPKSQNPVIKIYIYKHKKQNNAGHSVDSWRCTRPVGT